MAKREPTVAAVPLTKLSALKLVIPAFKKPNCISGDTVARAQEQRKIGRPALPRVASNWKKGLSRSCPNIPHATSVMFQRRSKAFFGGPVKKRPGFPYKAKNWELKLQLAECEGWLTELRATHEKLKEEHGGDQEAWQAQREALMGERDRLRDTVSSLEQSRAAADQQLREITSRYDQLKDDSKTFIGKTEETLKQRDSQIFELQSAMAELEAALQDQLMASEGWVRLLTMSEERLLAARDQLKSKQCDSEKQRLHSHSQMEDQLTTLQDQLAASEGRVRMLTESEQRLLTARDRLKSKLCDSENLRSQMEDQLTALQDQLAASEGRVQLLTESEQRLLTARDELKAKLRDSEHQRMELTALQDQLIASLARVLQRLLTFRDQLKSKQCDSEEQHLHSHSQV